MHALCAGKALRDNFLAVTWQSDCLAPRAASSSSFAQAEARAAACGALAMTRSSQLLSSLLREAAHMHVFGASKHCRQTHSTAQAKGHWVELISMWLQRIVLARTRTDTHNAVCEAIGMNRPSQQQRPASCTNLHSHKHPSLRTVLAITSISSKTDQHALNMRACCWLHIVISSRVVSSCMVSSCVVLSCMVSSCVVSSCMVSSCMMSCICLWHAWRHSKFEPNIRNYKKNRALIAHVASS